uniref:PH domain-containing protein n=1 Tax=Globisporangium ultimum (strain ATCC 200006 / CBS 805.95 / DAOM BR144) TaxID=431595 RepID=K3XBF4_GLOUD
MATTMMKPCYDTVPLTPACSSLRATILSSSSSFLSESGATSVNKLEDWVYWQRDGDKNPRCWTKVYAVMRNEFLWLYQREESAPKSVLLQLAVMSIEVSGDRQLRIVDPNGEDIDLWMLSIDAFEAWKEQLQQAAILTDEFFRSSCITAEDLPSESFYRGTLVAYRQLTKRTRCKAAMAKLARRWKAYMKRSGRSTA